MKPLLLDLRGKKVTIFGGGEVGLRKAKFFLPEAHVTVVSNAFVSGFDNLNVKKIKGDIREVMDHLIESSDFVIAATDDNHLNDSISESCKRYHIYHNRADELGTFLIPSVVSRDKFIIAISTLGRSPGMSKFLRLKLDQELGEEFGAMIELQEDLREKAKAVIEDQRRREVFLWEILNDKEIWDLLAVDPEGSRRLALSKMEGFR